MIMRNIGLIKVFIVVIVIFCYSVVKLDVVDDVVVVVIVKIDWFVGVLVDLVEVLVGKWVDVILEGIVEVWVGVMVNKGVDVIVDI